MGCGGSVAKSPQNDRVRTVLDASDLDRGEKIRRVENLVRNFDEQLGYLDVAPIVMALFPSRTDIVDSDIGTQELEPLVQLLAVEHDHLLCFARRPEERKADVFALVLSALPSAKVQVAAAGLSKRFALTSSKVEQGPTSTGTGGQNATSDRTLKWFLTAVDPLLELLMGFSDDGVARSFVLRGVVDGAALAGVSIASDDWCEIWNVGLRYGTVMPTEEFLRDPSKGKFFDSPEFLRQENAARLLSIFLADASSALQVRMWMVVLQEKYRHLITPQIAGALLQHSGFTDWDPDRSAIIEALKATPGEAHHHHSDAGGPMFGLLERAECLSAFISTQLWHLRAHVQVGLLNDLAASAPDVEKRKATLTFALSTREPLLSAQIADYSKSTLVPRLLPATLKSMIGFVTPFTTAIDIVLFFERLLQRSVTVYTGGPGSTAAAVEGHTSTSALRRSGSFAGNSGGVGLPRSASFASSGSGSLAKRASRSESPSTNGNEQLGRRSSMAEGLLARTGSFVRERPLSGGTGPQLRLTGAMADEEVPPTSFERLMAQLPLGVDDRIWLLEPLSTILSLNEYFNVRDHAVWTALRQHRVKALVNALAPERTRLQHAPRTSREAKYHTLHILGFLGNPDAIRAYWTTVLQLPLTTSEVAKPGQRERAARYLTATPLREPADSASGTPHTPLCIALKFGELRAAQTLAALEDAFLPEAERTAVTAGLLESVWYRNPSASGESHGTRPSPRLGNPATGHSGKDAVFSYFTHVVRVVLQVFPNINREEFSRQCVQSTPTVYAGHFPDEFARAVGHLKPKEAVMEGLCDALSRDDATYVAALKLPATPDILFHAKEHGAVRCFLALLRASMAHAEAADILAPFAEEKRKIDQSFSSLRHWFPPVELHTFEAVAECSTSVVVATLFTQTEAQALLERGPGASRHSGFSLAAPLASSRLPLLLAVSFAPRNTTLPKFVFRVKHVSSLPTEAFAAISHPRYSAEQVDPKSTAAKEPIEVLVEVIEEGLSAATLVAALHELKDSMLRVTYPHLVAALLRQWEAFVVFELVQVEWANRERLVEALVLSPAVTSVTEQLTAAEAARQVESLCQSLCDRSFCDGLALEPRAETLPVGQEANMIVCARWKSHPFHVITDADTGASVKVDLARHILPTQ